MDAADCIPLGQHEDVDAVFQILGMVPKQVSPESLLIEGQGMHHRAHGAIQNGDAFGEERLQQIRTGSRGRTRHQASCQQRAVRRGEDQHRTDRH